MGSNIIKLIEIVKENYFIIRKNLFQLSLHRLETGFYIKEIKKKT